MRTLILLSGLTLLGPAYALEVTVDTTSDTLLDACTPAAADCSLRGAITFANTGGADRIVFDIPTSDAGFVSATQHWRISTATDLPVIATALSIDGYTQPGAQENTLTPDAGGSNAQLKIELHGAGSAIGLFNGGALQVRGLVINGFTSSNLLINAPSGNLVEGCFIGTDVSGQNAVTANGNSQGIRLRGRATIGGITAAARNVISGNGYIGVWDESGATTTLPSTYQGNVFGLGADGTTMLPGQDYGLFMSGAAEGAQVGGDTIPERNLFGGNEVNAIYLSGNPASANTPLTRIQGNIFGSDWSGTLARPNGAFPAAANSPQATINIFRSGHCAVIVGGDGPGEGNLIAHGAAAGVQVSTCTHAALTGNIFAGNRIGIDLTPSSVADGPTTNDVDDADEGGNRLQNTPLIDSVVYSDSGATVTITYHVDSTITNAAYPLRIDVARGFGGQAFAPIMIDTYGGADAQQPRSVSFATSELMGQPLVLSATDADGNTSEFSSDLIFANAFEPQGNTDQVSD
ncbi:MAG: hypothetical protein K8F35_08875 [Dokdonella sp.]|uniref:hypothetical protein n=1 Tax=Dokdonella sp. TaxID=2291710 RepID=UPI001ACD13CE|nr:hypothetical protein [Dokdonella sp.]MBZ0223129.1 hypothetical protein [Dokdonella sp.]CAG1769336.1 hypothetical protein BAC2_00244 [uncultured bacterium]